MCLQDRGNQMSGNNNNAIMETIQKAHDNAPQMPLLECLAWIDALNRHKPKDTMRATEILNNRASRILVTSIADGQRQFAAPVQIYIHKNSNDASFLAKIVRYFGYIWIDATATSSVVSAVYNMSVARGIKAESSKPNILYRSLELLFVGIQKIILIALAIAAMPLMLGAAIVAAAAYILRLEKYSAAIFRSIGDQFQNIGTTLKSKTNWNVFYPILVAVPGLALKATLVSIAIAALPLMAIPAMVAGVAYLQGKTLTSKAIMLPIDAVIGLIATVPLSNLNPIIAVKTIFFDTFTSAAHVDRSIKAASEAKKAVPKTNKEAAANQNVVKVENEANILEAISKIVATFDIKEGLRNDKIITASKTVGNGYIITPIRSAWNPLNLSGKPLVLEVNEKDHSGKNVLVGIITYAKIGNNNNLEFQFKENVSAHTQVMLTIAFAKMSLAIATIKPKGNAVTSEGLIEPQKIILDLTNCKYATGELITANVPELKKNKGAVVEFIEKPQELNIVDPAANIEEEYSPAPSTPLESRVDPAPTIDDSKSKLDPHESIKKIRRDLNKV